jgi:hypothetical protein
MAQALTLWAQEVYSHIMGVPEPAIQDAGVNAARQFCEKTLLWTTELDRISVVADQRAYTITIPPALNGELVEVGNVRYKQNAQTDDQFVPLDPITEVAMDLDQYQYNTSRGAWKFQTAETPRAHYMDPALPTTMYLWRIPTVASTEGLLVRVCLKPTKTATSVADFLYTLHYDAILLGILAELYGRNTMPWADPRKQTEHTLAFLAAINAAKTRKWAGMNKRPMRVRVRPFV